MSYGYTLNLVLLNKSANARSLGVKLGRICIKYGVPVTEAAERLGVSRQAVYNWFSGEAIPNAKTSLKIKKLISEIER